MENDKQIPVLECGTHKENTFWIFGDDYSHEIVKQETETVNLNEGFHETSKRMAHLRQVWGRNKRK